MLIAQMTDIHARPAGLACNRVAETNMLFERALTTLMAIEPRPECLLITGDLTDTGHADEYASVHDALRRMPIPVYAVPGNHDNREEFRVAFNNAAFFPEHDVFVHYAIESHWVRIIALDTTVPEADHGELCAERLEWLETKLAEDTERPTLVMMHHPPFDTGIGFMDEIGLLEGRDAFIDIISKNPQVERILCGHVHRPMQALCGRTLAMIAPATGHQVIFDISPNPRPMLVMEPSAFMLHAWTQEQGIVSHQVYAGDYDGPYPFTDW